MQAGHHLFSRLRDTEVDNTALPAPYCPLDADHKDS